MMFGETALITLRDRRPEWAPWLAVVENVLREAGEPAWEEAVPATPSGRPLLARAALSVPERPVHRLLDRLIRTASSGGTVQMASLRGVRHRDVDVLMLFKSSLCNDSGPAGALAAVSGANAEALQAITALLAVPFLHACNRRWPSSLYESWVEGHCPVCGAWPAFAEVRGIERSRYYRCGRCGGEWHARALHCPYCSTSDHDELVSLVPGKADAHAVIEACRHCLGYVKAFTRLQGCAPGAVMLEDLASVDLDVAALEQGYARPSGAGRPLEVAITGKTAPRRFFGWNA